MNTNTFKGRVLAPQDYANVWMSRIVAVGHSGEQDNSMGVWATDAGCIPVKICGQYRASTGLAIEKIVCVDDAYASKEEANEAVRACRD